MIRVGTKMFDAEEPGIFGIVWRVVAIAGRGQNYRIRWSDGSVTCGLNSTMLERGGYFAEDDHDQ